ncbi:MAG: hypothetical protein JJU36_00915 [Phycisphaeraceae bacterium]|nr:hypothetical protein [Phycisphaeraceae bacterium]
MWLNENMAADRVPSKMHIAILMVFGLLCSGCEKHCFVDLISDHEWMNVEIEIEMREGKYAPLQATLSAPVVVARGVRPGSSLWLAYTHGIVGYIDWETREVEQVCFWIRRGRHPFPASDRPLEDWSRDVGHFVRTFHSYKSDCDLGDLSRHFSNYETWTRDEKGRFHPLRMDAPDSERLPEHPKTR